MYSVYKAPAFERDVKRCAKKHWDMAILREAISTLIHSDEKPIPDKFHDHALVGDKQGKRELHVGGKNSNWLVLYSLEDGVVNLARTGTHDELFR